MVPEKQTSDSAIMLDFPGLRFYPLRRKIFQHSILSGYP
jgi:hypothetical protein